MRDCPDTECMGECETCNRAPIENRPLPRQFLPDGEALEAAIVRIRNGSGTQDDAQRLLCAYQGLCARLEQLEERLGSGT